MTAYDLLASCALDAIREPVPSNTCVIWIVTLSRSGCETTRRTFAPVDSSPLVAPEWVDLLAKAVSEDRAIFVPTTKVRARAYGHLTPVSAIPPAIAVGMAVLLPSVHVPVLEVVLNAGPAIELPWLEGSANLGLGRRFVLREHSVAAALLFVAQQALLATWN